jgi:hypothetical protein
VDILLILGVLHHTEGRANLILRLGDLLSLGGYMVVDEPLNRSPLTRHPFYSGIGSSPHEGRIDKTEFLTNIQKRGDLTTIVSRERYSAFFTLMLLILRRSMLKHKVLFSTLSYIDLKLTKLFGDSFSLFGPGELMLVLHREEAVRRLDSDLECRGGQ